MIRHGMIPRAFECESYDVHAYAVRNQAGCVGQGQSLTSLPNQYRCKSKHYFRKPDTESKKTAAECAIPTRTA